MTESSAERRLLIALLAFNLIILSVMVYGTDGTDVNAGRFDGLPFPYYVPYGTAVILSLVVFAIGASLFIASPIIASRKRAERLPLTLAFVALWAALASTFLVLYHGRILVSGGKEDSYVIQEAAAMELLRGVNPYTANYTSYLLSMTYINKLTLIYSGGPPFNASKAVGFVTMLDYPAFSFLYYVPAIVLHVPGNVWDAVVLGAALATVYLKLKGGARDLFPLVAASGAFYIITDPAFFDPIAGWLAPSVLAVTLIDNPIVGGALMGLAVSYRQYVAALALIYFAVMLRRLKRRGLAKGLVSFTITAVLINAPFLLVSPHAFISHVLFPAEARFDLEGFGVASLYFVIHKLINRLALYIALATTLIIGIVFTLKVSNVMVPTAFIFPALALFAYPRPLYSYWLWFPLLGLMYMLFDLDCEGSAKARLLSTEAVGLVSLTLLASIYAGGFVGNLGPLMSIVLVICSALLPPLARLLAASRATDDIATTVTLILGLGAVAYFVGRMLTRPTISMLEASSTLASSYLLSLRLPITISSMPYGTEWPKDLEGLPLMISLASGLTSSAALVAPLFKALLSRDDLLLKAAVFADGVVTLPLLASGPLVSLGAIAIVASAIIYNRSGPSKATSALLGVLTPLAPSAVPLWIMELLDDRPSRKHVVMYSVIFITSAAASVAAAALTRIGLAAELKWWELTALALTPFAYVVTRRIYGRASMALLAAIPAALLGEYAVTISLAWASLLVCSEGCFKGDEAFHIA